LAELSARIALPFEHNGPVNTAANPSTNASQPPPADDRHADLFDALADELRVVAQSLLASERPGHTLQPTALINELWLRMAPSDGRPQCRFESRAAFMAYASRAIRNILVDHARRKRAAKRGGTEWTQSGDCDLLPCPLQGVLQGRSMLELDEEINLLEKAQNQCAQVFELRFFGGMSTQEIADWLDMPTQMVRTNWEFARAWLASRLGPHDADGSRNKEHDNSDT